MGEAKDFDGRLDDCIEQVHEMQKIVAGDSLADRLRMEATASEELDDSDSSIVAMREAAMMIEELVKALEDIAKGVGRFSRDPLEHCSNTVDDMKETATAALDKARGETP